MVLGGRHRDEIICGVQPSHDDRQIDGLEVPYLALPGKPTGGVMSV